MVNKRLTFCSKDLWSPAIENGPHRLNIVGQGMKSRLNVVLTVALRLIPTVLILTAQVDFTRIKTMQKNAVTKVLPANDHLRPRRDSIR